MSNDPICPTHPFLTFSLDLTRFKYSDWLMIGEACSKIAHVTGVPLQPDTARKHYLLWLVKGAQATTAIEGNTLSEDQVRNIVHGESKLPPSQAYLEQEVRNVVDACNEVLDGLAKDPENGLKLDEAWIKRQNALLLRGVPVEEGVHPGEYRHYVVGVGRYRAPEPKYVPELMRRYVAWLHTMLDGVPPELERPMQIVRAIVGHLYFAWIHPFGDGNGRTARMIEFALQLRAGVPSASAHILSNHYNQTRSKYYQEFDRASSTGDVFGFISYSLQGLVDGLREQVFSIQEEQLQVTWRNYVFQTVNPASPTHKRQAWLAIDLAGRSEGVPKKDLITLSSRLAREYMSKTPKTLTRDLNALRERKLIVNRAGRWHANLDLVRAFRPFTTDRDA